MRKYAFNWDLIGDIEGSRSNLGKSVDLDLYRLMQFTLRDVLEEKCGGEVVDEVFFEAGRLAGKEFFRHLIVPVTSLDEFVRKTQEVLITKKIGIMRIEEATFDEGKVLLTIDEDLDCSGLPVLDNEICVYDEGFITGLFEEFTQENWTAKEIDCWCTGARTCRFLVTRK